MQRARACGPAACTGLASWRIGHPERRRYSSIPYMEREMTLPTPDRRVLLRVFCTALLTLTFLLLLIAWFTRSSGLEPVSLSIVFAAALVGRCLLGMPGEAAPARADR